MSSSHETFVKETHWFLGGYRRIGPAMTDSDAADTPTNLVEVQRRRRAYKTLSSVVYLVTSGPADTLVR